MSKEVLQTATRRNPVAEAYEAYKYLLPETPAGTWGAWIRLGQREKERMFNREEQWRCNSL